MPFGNNVIEIVLLANDQASGALKGVARTTNATVGLIRKSFAGLAGALSARELVRTADTYTNISNRLRLVATDTKNLAAITEELFRVSQQTRSSFESTAALYSRVARNAAQLGLSQKEVLDLSTAVNQAIQISGATTAEASAGVIQFSQALASGALRGDELRSVLENMPRLATAISQGLGVTLGELRKLGEEGKLTAEEIVRAIQRTAPGIAAEFEQIRPTIGQAFTQIANSITRFVGQMDEAHGASATFAGALTSVAEHIDELNDAFRGTLDAQTELSTGFKLIATAALIAQRIVSIGITAVWVPIKELFTSIGKLLGGVFAAITAAFRGDFNQAKEILKETFTDIGQSIYTNFSQAGDQIIADTSRTIEAVIKLWDKGARDIKEAQAKIGTVGGAGASVFSGSAELVEGIEKLGTDIRDAFDVDFEVSIGAIGDSIQTEYERFQELSRAAIDGAENLRDLYRRLDEETETTAERSARQIADFQAKVRLLVLEGSITEEQAAKRLEEFKDRQDSVLKSVVESARRATEQIHDAFANVFARIGEGGLRGFARSVLEAIRTMMANILATILINVLGIERLMKRLAAAVGGVGGSGGGGGGSGVIGGAIVGGLRAIFGFAGGGRSRGLAMVGEEGPELVNFGAGAQVFNSRQLAFAGAGMRSINFAPQTNIVIEARDSDANALRQEFGAALAFSNAKQEQRFQRILQENGLGRVR